MTPDVNAMIAATQIHSSLLSISVGAVLLPAAFHFAITYGGHSKGEAEPSLQEQKEDILRMSHGVSTPVRYPFSIAHHRILHAAGGCCTLVQCVLLIRYPALVAPA